MFSCYSSYKLRLTLAKPGFIKRPLSTRGEGRESEKVVQGPKVVKERTGVWNKISLNSVALLELKVFKWFVWTTESSRESVKNHFPKCRPYKASLGASFSPLPQPSGWIETCCEGPFLEHDIREYDSFRQSGMSHRGAEPQKRSLETPVFKNWRPRLPEGWSIL